MPCSFTISWLFTRLFCALDILVCKWTSISTVLELLVHSIPPTLLIRVIFLVIKTIRIIKPFTYAVHWLATAISGALLVGVDVWASKSVVSDIGADGVVPAASVLVVIVVMVAGAIGAPVS